MKTQLKNLIRRSIDLHVHIGPEIIPRKFNSVESLVKAEKGKIKGLALKNHFYPTQPFINQVKNQQGLTLIGSLTLNSFQGGLNPSAIYANALISNLPTIVWLPTISAKNFLKKNKYEVPPEWINNNQIKSRLANQAPIVKINQNLNSVLKQIKKSKAILATGHITWQESLKVIKQAQQIGIKKIILTHPIYQPINMPINQQKKLAKKGIIIEQCYSMYSIDKIPIKNIVQQIKSIGANNCILSSDVGQKFSPNPSQALYLFDNLLIKNGLTIQELETMLVINPQKLLNCR